MRNAKGFFCITLIAALLCSLCACGAAPKAAISADEAGTPPVQSEAPPVIAAPKPSDETVPGYISTRLENPGWADSWDGCEAVGDTLYIAAYTREGGIAAAGYDTLSGQWLRYDLETENVLYPYISGFSAAAGSLWLLLRDGYSVAEKESRDYTRKLDYHLVHMDLNTGEQSCTRLDFWKEGDAYLCSFIALDAGRVLAGDGEKVYLLGSGGDILGMPDIRVLGTGLHARAGDALYIETESGLSLLDTETLQYGGAVSRLGHPVYSSSLDHLLFTQNEALYRTDPATGERAALLSWLDTALSYSNMYGWQGFENSNGDIYHLTDVLTRVSRGEVPVKKTLTLACLGDASDELYQYSSKEYACPDSLMDAVIRFNNSDPEFRIEIKPLVYHDEAERNRILTGLATESGIDILDTSLLPEGAVDRQLLVDLLPYNADAEITCDLPAAIGLRARMALKGDYIPVGFPEAAGNGSYFMKLGASDPSGGFGRATPEICTGGCNASLGIMASGADRDGAWRFLRTFMMGEAEPSLFKGIPARRDSFERAVEAELRNEQPDHYGEFELFNDTDAEYLRELVYSTDRVVCPDESVIRTIQKEINAFLGGKYTAGEAAGQIQSRLSIYMAEQN